MPPVSYTYAQPQLKLWSGPINFLCLLIKLNNLVSHKDAALLQESACSDEWVAGFTEDEGISRHGYFPQK